MAGTDWEDAYIPKGIRAGRRMAGRASLRKCLLTSGTDSDSTAHSFAVKVPGAVVCYLLPAEGLNVTTSLQFYLGRGFSLMVVDGERAHSKSRGTCSGLAVWTIYDALAVGWVCMWWSGWEEGL